MESSPTLVVSLISMLTMLGGGAFAFLIKDRQRILDELRISNQEKYATLAATAKVAEKVPEMVAQNQTMTLEIQRLNQRIADLERK